MNRHLYMMLFVVLTSVYLFGTVGCTTSQLKPCANACARQNMLEFSDENLVCKCQESTYE